MNRFRGYGLCGVVSLSLSLSFCVNRVDSVCSYHFYPKKKFLGRFFFSHSSIFSIHKKIYLPHTSLPIRVNLRPINSVCYLCNRKLYKQIWIIFFGSVLIIPPFVVVKFHFVILFLSLSLSLSLNLFFTNQIHLHHLHFIFFFLKSAT